MSVDEADSINNKMDLDRLVELFDSKTGSVSFEASWTEDRVAMQSEDKFSL